MKIPAVVNWKTNKEANWVYHAKQKKWETIWVPIAKERRKLFETIDRKRKK